MRSSPSLTSSRPAGHAGDGAAAVQLDHRPADRYRLQRRSHAVLGDEQRERRLHHVVRREAEQLGRPAGLGEVGVKRHLHVRPVVVGELQHRRRISGRIRAEVLLRWIANDACLVAAAEPSRGSSETRVRTAALRSPTRAACARSVAARPPPADAPRVAEARRSCCKAGWSGTPPVAQWRRGRERLPQADRRRVRAHEQDPRGGPRGSAARDGRPRRRAAGHPCRAAADEPARGTARPGLPALARGHVRVLEDMSDQLRANTRAVLAMLDRFERGDGPAAAGA